MSETVKCPKCSTDVDSGAGFGMLTCQNCNEIFMMGDEPKTGETIAPSLTADSSAVMPTLVSEGVAPTMAGFDPSFATAVEPEPPVQEVIEPAPIAMPTPSSEFTDLAPSESVPTPTVEGEQKNAMSFDEPLQVAQQQASSDMKDVAAFGNKELTSTAAGGLVFDIKIEGIDTSEIRKDFADCLMDRKLGMDVSELLAKIKNGEMYIKQVNPVKASVIINRIKHLPLKVSWTTQQLVKMVLVLALSFVGFHAEAADYGRHEANLSGYAIKINNLQDEIRELIEKKKTKTTPDERDVILREIIKKNDELRNIYKEFKKEKEHVLFEHPEQGDKTIRRYRRMKLKTLEDLENEGGLDGDLSRARRKAHEVFPAGSPSPSPASSASPIKK